MNPAQAATGPILAVDGLQVEITRGRHRYPTVTDVTLSLVAGETVGLVGESGSGKSLTLRAIADTLPPTTRRIAGTVTGDTGRRPRMAMVFQEPMAAMNPTRSVGDAIADVVQAHHRSSRRTALDKATDLLREVGVPDPKRRLTAYPHQLSGGLRQRVIIAAALATDPQILLCDEPTTALDVTVQDQILGLLDGLRIDRGMSIIFVTHDLAVVATLCQRIAVMYAGQIVETGPTADILADPHHPYTAALLQASRTRTHRTAAAPIGGQPPDPASFPPGCRFTPRCPHAIAACSQATYALTGTPQRADACIRSDSLTGALRSETAR